MGDAQRVGFIGLGVMGAPMAGRLVAAGHDVVVHNRSRGAVDRLVEQGARAGDSPRAVAAESDIVITMLPDSPDVEAVILGADGVLEGARSGALVVDMSSIAPATARRVHAALTERGVDALDAPVSGGEPAARDGKLSIMVGGDAAALETARPLLELLGTTITHIGPAGSGQVAKAANQMIVAVTIQVVGEALALTRGAGADPETVRTALLGGFAQSRILEVHGRRMLDETFDPGFRVDLHRKDLEIALATARESNVPAPTTALVAQFLGALIARGDGDRDHSSLARLFETG